MQIQSFFFFPPSLPAAAILPPTLLFAEGVDEEDFLLGFNTDGDGCNDAEEDDGSCCGCCCCCEGPSELSSSVLTVTAAERLVADADEDEVATTIESTSGKDFCETSGLD